MSSYPISFLLGNPHLDAAEIEAERRPPLTPGSPLPDDPELEREMAEAFGWDEPWTAEDWSAWENQLRRQAEDEQTRKAV